MDKIAAGIGTLYGFDAAENRLVDTAALSALLGYGESELEGKPTDTLLGTDSMGAAEAIASGQTDVLAPFTKKDGSPFWGLHITLEKSDNLHRMLLIPAPYTGARTQESAESMAELQERLDRNEQMIGSLCLRASQDSLTKILNAASSRQLAEEYLAQSEPCCAILVIDLDDFKAVNDTWGHMFGDTVLIRVAETIRRLFRSGDIVGRIGGDEFFVLMKGTCDCELISRRCETVIAELGALRFAANKEARIGCSVGAALCLDGGCDYKTLFNAADRALYLAKSAGGGQYRLAPIPENAEKKETEV